MGNNKSSSGGSKRNYDSKPPPIPSHPRKQPENNSYANQKYLPTPPPPDSKSPRSAGNASSAAAAAAGRIPPPARPDSIKNYIPPPLPKDENYSEEELKRRSKMKRGSVKLKPGAWTDPAYLDSKHLGRTFGPYYCLHCRSRFPITLNNAKVPYFLHCEKCNKVTSALFARLVQPTTEASLETLQVQNLRGGESAQDEWCRDPADGRYLMWIRVMTPNEEQRVKDIYPEFENLSVEELRERYTTAAMKEDISPPQIAYDLEMTKSRDELVELCVVITAWSSSDFARAGYVRRCERNGEIAWLPAPDYITDPIRELSGLGITSHAICEACALSFDDRVNWFRNQIQRMRIPSEEGPLNIRIRRDCLLEDASTCFMTLPPQDLWKMCRYEFVGERAMDSGGVAREFFTLVANLIFDPAFGLFEPLNSETSIHYRINPNSGIANDLHLQYFRFAGRLLGKALIDGYTVSAHLTPDVYKHILSAPLSIRDMIYIDPTLARSAEQIMECEDVEALCLDFTAGIWKLGVTDVIELKENGANIPVTNANREEYLELLQKYIMLDRHRLQLSFFLRGFDELIPSCLLAVFSAAELETILCGRSTIELDDWKSHTVYRGEFKEPKATHEVIRWFWEILEEKSEKERADLLMFSTGSDRVPVQGFKALQGDDGSNMLFSVESIPLTQSLHPRAHTCFNRLELPLYRSKEDMRRYLDEGVQMGNGGFSME